MSDNRFVKIYSQQEPGRNDVYTSVLKDTVTGVLYLCKENYRYQNGGIGLTVLVDRDGKPLTDTYQVTI